MAKRFFIRRSHGDLVQEQNRLLETLLAKQDVVKTTRTSDYQDYLSSRDAQQDPAPTQANDIGYLDLDDLPYIPTTHQSSASLSVDTNKATFDGEGVEKLRKTRANAKLD